MIEAISVDRRDLILGRISHHLMGPIYNAREWHIEGEPPPIGWDGLKQNFKIASTNDTKPDLFPNEYGIKTKVIDFIQLGVDPNWSDKAAINNLVVQGEKLIEFIGNVAS